jgi:hypothetical protein
LPFTKVAHPQIIQERNLTMATILITNAVSSLVAAVGIGGLLLRNTRRLRRRAMVQPVYATSTTARPPLPS